jgi:hypothetical protein
LSTPTVGWVFIFAMVVRAPEICVLLHHSPPPSCVARGDDEAKDDKHAFLCFQFASDEKMLNVCLSNPMMVGVDECYQNLLLWMLFSGGKLCCVTH